MNSLVELYEGRSIATARPVATSADPELVRMVAERLLDRPFCGDPQEPDAIRLDAYWRRALHRVRDDTEGPRE